MDARMGTESVNRLLLKSAAPLMLSLLINSLYNFVDSVFISRVSEAALTGLSLAAPIQTLVSALGCGNAIGLNAAVSRALGEKNEGEVKASVAASLFIAFCSWALIAVGAVLCVGPYLRWQAGGNAQIAAYAQSYLMICMLFSFGQMGQWVFDRLVIASGRSGLFLFTLSAASLTNLVLDPILIFGYFGLPAMGVRGAAWATVIGQITGAVAGYFINRRYNKAIPIAFALRPKGRSVAQILRVGVPTALVQGVTSFVGMAMNAILIGFSTTAVAVYGICARMQGLMTVAVHGVTNGLIPIVAYNLGARKTERIHACLRWAVLDAALLYAVFLAALELAPQPVLRLFEASPDMMAAGVPAIRIFAVTWLLSIPCLVLAAVFQALSKGAYSMALTMLRQVLLPLVLMLMARSLGSLSVLWMALAVAELLTIPVGVLLWMKCRRALPAELIKTKEALAS